MQKTKIEWADYVFNPIKGVCPVGCWYCWARKIYKRFGKKYFLDGDKPTEPILDDRELFGLDRIKKPSRIFVCSTYEFFHPYATFTRGQILFEINKHPQHTFIILTKMPENIDWMMPDNVWLGVSVEGRDQWDRVRKLKKMIARIRFVSLEPFLGQTPVLKETPHIDWLVIGRLTGHGRRRDPELAAIQSLVAQARTLDIPVFLKNNLRDIWGSNLIQEFPK